MMPRLRLQWGYRSELFPVAAYWRTGLREACVLGAVVVALVPAARGHHDWFGCLPLWLLAMPALACWLVHGAPWPRLTRAAAVPRSSRPRRAGVGQARRLPRRFGGVVTTGRGQPTLACGSVRGQ